MKLHEKALEIDTKGYTVKICYSLEEKRESWLDFQKL